MPGLGSEGRPLRTACPEACGEDGCPAGQVEGGHGDKDKQKALKGLRLLTVCSGIQP